MTPSIEERELAIESLLELAESHEVNWPSLLITLGATDRENAIERICELTTHPHGNSPSRTTSGFWIDAGSLRPRTPVSRRL